MTKPGPIVADGHGDASADRIRRVRGIYTELMPGLAARLQPMAGPEQSVVMPRPRLNRLQALLTVAGGLRVITSIVLGADAGVLMYGLHAPLAAAIIVGAVVGALIAAAGVRFQTARWRGAEAVRLDDVDGGQQLVTGL